MTIIIAVSNLLGTGGSTLFSGLLGSNDAKKTGQCSAATLYLSLIFGLIATSISLMFLGEITALLIAGVNTFDRIK